MGGLLVGGDYPGFALRAIESAHPGATALFVQGCSGDVRPNNVDAAGAFRSGPLEVVESFGKRLGASVLEALESTARPVEGGLRIGSETVDLPLDPHPSREDLADALGDSSSVRREWARSILDAYSAGADLPTSIPVHVQALQIGDSLALVAISGEVCVEIGLRIKRLIGDRPRFVLGYANRVQWYIPSRTVRREGGYEADSFYYHGAPSPYDEAAEDILAETAERMLG